MEWPAEGGVYAFILALYLGEVGAAFLFFCKHKDVPKGCATPTDGDVEKKIITRGYTRGGAVLVAAGLGGFVPSLSMLVYHGKVWSVQHNAPHSDVNTVLLLHIVGALAWGVCMILQLITGGVAQWRTAHRVAGYVGYIALSLGVALSGGILYTTIVDFGAEDPDYGAGLYTYILGVVAWGNMTAAIVYARRRNMPRHKDHALMAMMWTLDPGVHRSMMWLMRLGCVSCYPTEGNWPLLVPGKLLANLFLILWCISTAFIAGRLNGITIGNALGQWMLCLLGVGSLIASEFHSTALAVGVTLGIALLGVAALYAIWQHRNRQIAYSIGMPSADSLLQNSAPDLEEK